MTAASTHSGAPLTHRGRSAFTLAELLLCIGLIAILAAWLAEYLQWRQSPKPEFSRPAVFSPDLTLLASGDFSGLSDDRLIMLCDTETGYLRTLGGQSEDMFSLAFSSDGNLLAAGTKETIKMWDARTGRERATFKDAALIYSFAFSPDGRTLATVNEHEGVDIWDVGTQHKVTTIHPNIGTAMAAFSPDGQTLAMGGLMGEIGLWDFKQSREEMMFQAHNEEIVSLAFSPDGTKLATGSYDSTVKLWDLTNGQLLATTKHDVETPRPAEGASGSVAAAFSPDGKLLASIGEDAELKVCQILEGRLLAERVSSRVAALAFSRDDKTLATASDDGVIRFWDVGSWQLRRTAVFGAKRPLRWTPFAIGLAAWIVVWNALRRRRRSQRLARARR